MLNAYLIILSLASGSFLFEPMPSVVGKYNAIVFSSVSRDDSFNLEKMNKAPACTELFISEYVEGTFENKFIEIYNPSAGIINLANYALEIYNNGANTPNYIINLSGNIDPYDVFVIADPDETFSVIPDQTTNNLSFNGNDAIALTKSGIFIDVIGQIGADPGTDWLGGGCSTQNRTLVRNGAIASGDMDGTNSFDPSLEWICYAVDTSNFLGGHTSGCEIPAPELQLIDASNANQNCGFIMDFGNVASDGSFLDLSVSIENNGSADLNISNFGITGDYTMITSNAPITITAGSVHLMTLRFTPSANGLRTGLFTITNNDSDESVCVINLTGFAFTPAPEIDIERNTLASITNGNSANTGNNTIFAATAIGFYTASKTFYIRNEGTANLTINEISSSNNSEFPITLIHPSPLGTPPPLYVLSPGAVIEFELLFSPNIIGLRTSIITVISDDSDENPYVFEVQGNSVCAAPSVSISPVSGPIGSKITITGGTDFGPSTSATVNGIAAAILPGGTVSTIELLVPLGASTGSIEIIDDTGCLSTAFFTVIEGLISSCEGMTATLPPNLFISEVTDKGSGSHSYVEIYNGRNNAINLNNYELRIHNNGVVNATTTIPLSGTIASHDVIVVAFGSTNATDPEGGYIADFFSGGSGINEDDHIRLYEGSNWVDLWGDPSGNPFTITSKNYTYRRKNLGVPLPSLIWNPANWSSFTPVDYSNIGIYDFSLGSPPNIDTGPVLNLNCRTAEIGIMASEGFAGGKLLTYQWYFSNPGDVGWTEVQDDANYNNVTSSTLSILDVFSVLNTQYYCQIQEDDSMCFTPSDAIQINLPETTWTNLGWTNGPPTSNTLATIDYMYNTSINGNINACNLIVNGGNTLAVADATYIQVGHDVLNNGVIEIETKGGFIQDGVGSFAGTFINNGITRVKKSTATTMSDLGSSHIYTYWSSPTKNTDVTSVFPTPTGSRRYYYEAENYLDRHTVGTVNGIPDDIDDNGDDWQNAVGTMDIGRGYAITSSQPIGYPFSDQVTFENVGVGGLNTGDYSVKVFRNDIELSDINWNLLGNPYASAIDFDKFIAANASVLDGVVYLWSHASPESVTNPGNQPYNYAQDDYAIINTVGGVAGGSTIIPEKFIPSGQGFFVSFLNGGITSSCANLPTNVVCGDVIFTNDMRLANTTSNLQFFDVIERKADKKNSVEPHRIWVNLSSDNGVFNQILVAYIQDATNDYDGMSFDTRRNLSSGNASNIYSMIEELGTQKFAIQAKSPSSLTIEEVIPIGFKTAIETPTLYKLSIPKIEGSFFDDNKLYIKDKLLSKIHDLSLSDYSFISEKGEFNSRFELSFGNGLLTNNIESLGTDVLTITELKNHDVSFKISENLMLSKIEILDIHGAILHQIKASDQIHIENLSILNTAPYIARVTLSNTVVISKIFVKQ